MYLLEQSDSYGKQVTHTSTITYPQTFKSLFLIALLYLVKHILSDPLVGVEWCLMDLFISIFLIHNETEHGSSYFHHLCKICLVLFLFSLYCSLFCMLSSTAFYYYNCTPEARQLIKKYISFIILVAGDSKSMATAFVQPLVRCSMQTTRRQVC